MKIIAPEDYVPSEIMRRVAAGETVTLECGCTVPPGCKCEDRTGEAAKMTAVFMEATGLTFDELFALRNEYLQRGDVKGLMIKLHSLAAARGITLLLGKEEP